MYSKVFQQIFESSISEDHVIRHIFMDLLVLANKHGEVDMTAQAISRRTNVPLELIQRSLISLGSPDPTSRTPEEDGRRIVLLDEHRDWGWRIVNFEHYNSMRNEDARREYFREYKRKYRQRKTNELEGNVQDESGQSNNVHHTSNVSTPTDSYANTKKTSRGKPASDPRHSLFKAVLEKAWVAKNKNAMPWSPGEAKQLSNLLSANPDLSENQFTQMLRNRHKSEGVNHAQRPRSWIESVTDFAAGPLNRFRQPLEQASTVKPVSLIEKYERQMAE